ARQSLLVPTAGLAEAIAAEWREQGDDIRPATLPLTRMASTAIDRMPEQRDATIEELAGYAGTDLLCYRAAEPFELVERQRRVWQPLLNWAGDTYDARLAVTTAVLPVPQPEPALKRLRGAAEALGNWPLVGVHAATTRLGSLVLGLALHRGRVGSKEALAASLLDELFEIERWGTDREIERRHATLRREVEATAQFLSRLA
ncbi:MAG: ATP12 family chaperone protein, partial [Geminicoccales bacterium]